MRKILLALLVLFAVFASPLAHASNLYISEYKSIATINVYQAEIAPEPGIDQAPVSFASGAGSSAPFASTTHLVRVWCDAQCSILFGPSPQTATNANKPLAAGSAEYFAVVPGQIVSVHSNP